MKVLRIYPTANDRRHRERDRALTELGVDVALVAPVSYGPDWSPTPIEPEMKHWRSRLLNRNSIPFHLWDPRVLRRAVREFDPDLVDVHDECYFPAARQAVHAVDGRAIVMFAAQNIPKHYPWAVRRMRESVFSRVSAFYPCSAEAGTVLREWGYAGPLDVIPYGVEDQLFQVGATGDRIGFIGRLSAEKGVRELLTFGRRLLCVGSGPLADEIRASGAEVVLAPSLDELVEQLKRMAVLAMPSRTVGNWKEQFGRTAIEAMAAGVPVVAYDSGSLPEVVGGAGILIREGDTAGFVSAVEAVLQEPGTLGERGRSWAWERYRWSTVAADMIRLYEAALSR
jgi:glycosyltransferase involved in cell wall biosynthesis